MAFVTKRNNVQDEILLLLPIPLETSTRVYYEEDLVEMGLPKVLDGYPEEVRRVVLEQASIFSSIKPELAFQFLQNFPRLFRLLPLDDVGKWVAIALDIYDKGGLNPALEFILGMEEHPSFTIRWGRGVPFREIYGVLTHYLRGLGRQEIHLKPGKALYTDFLTIHLPERVGLFRERESNFLLYKLMVTHKFAQIRLGSLFLDSVDPLRLERVLRERYHKPSPPNSSSALGRFFGLFPEPRLAADLFIFCDTVRVERWMAGELPGLYRDLERLKKEMGQRRRRVKDLPVKSRVVDTLISWFLASGENPADLSVMETARKIAGLITQRKSGLKRNEHTAGMVSDLYHMMDPLPGVYRKVEPVPYAGELRPDEAERGREKRRRSLRTHFQETLTDFIRGLPETREVRIEIPETELERGSSRSNPRQEVPRDLLVNGNPVPIPEGLQKVIEEIYEDLGSIPASYLATTNDMSGHYFRPLLRRPDPTPEQAQGTPFAFSEDAPGVHALDEWDHRRHGYRKRWALLRETVAESGNLQFAEEILAQYGGMVRQIKRQFERMRMEPMLLRRQKEGDEVDLDAAVEAYHDRSAGLSPSEGLYVRMSRELRNIATVFLLDLSGSTSGWINDMERSALLILSEAMQMLQDRFSIYGFSGRTRKRCELFRIKGFDEPYSDQVKRRIANLRALEYTRLGPPIRYLTRRLGEVEARTRLLITLTDGKPDDYDGYSGDYGIEDTRHALIEARRSGIHPFCITIDKSEHSYLAHMYGPANYVFIDDLSRLPLRVPEIYRKLTT